MRGFRGFPAPLLFLALTAGCGGDADFAEVPDPSVEPTYEPSPMPMDSMPMDSMSMDSMWIPEQRRTAGDYDDLAYAEVAVRALPDSAELYLVPLREYERMTDVRAALVRGNRYYRGTAGDGPVVVEGREMAYVLVARTGDLLEIREVRLRAGVVDTVTIQVRG